MDRQSSERMAALLLLLFAAFLAVILVIGARSFNHKPAPTPTPVSSR